MAAPNTQSILQPARVRYARRAYRLIAWLFAAFVIIQVFVAGMAIFVDPVRWGWHRTLAHSVEPLAILLIVLAFAGRLPVRMRWLSALPFVQMWLQYATTGIGGIAAAFHPVNAMLMFWVLVMLARRPELEVARDPNTLPATSQSQSIEQI